jgi:hypothetical protein
VLRSIFGPRTPPTYPQRPVRAALIAFVALATYVAAFMPFDEELRKGWPLALCYCAFLAVTGIGLVRLGPRAVLFLIVASVAMILLAIVGMAIVFSSDSPLNSSGWWWLQASLYLFYGLGVCTVCMVGRGWFLYLKR